VEADVYADGHDPLAGALKWRHEKETRWKELPLEPLGNDRWRARFTVDRLGRLLVPKTLKEFAQIKQDVVIAGISNRMEIWSKEKWQAFYESSRQSFEEVAERVMLE